MEYCNSKLENLGLLSKYAYQHFESQSPIYSYFDFDL